MTNAVNLASAAGTGFAFRNRIINGDMRIDQRNLGAAVTISADSYSIDRWRCRNAANVSSQYTVQQSSVAPPGFSNSILVTNGSARTPTTSDRFSVEQYFEGHTIADLGWGASGAQPVTLSFWVRSSVTGLFGGAIRSYQNAASACYPFSFTISAANTWQYVSVVIPGPNIGTWGSGTNGSVVVGFNLGNNASVLGTSGTWAASELWGPTGAVSFVSNASATFYLTGVQLEVGSVATPFERRPYGLEEMLCKRYCIVLKGQGGYTPFGMGAFVGSSLAYVFVPFPVTMRASPSVAFSAANTFYIDGPGVASSITADQSGPYGITINAGASGSFTVGTPTRLLANNNSTATITIVSEL